MVDVARLHEALAGHRPGTSLPQSLYIDPSMHEADMAAIFGREWLFACNGCEIARPGDYITLAIGADSVIVLRDRAGQIRAFHNSCRHRGSRICLEERGRAPRLTCPYHQWVYDLDGSLVHARQMPADFRLDDQGLAEVALEVICGMVYVCLAETPPDIARFRAAVTPFIAPHRPDRVKVAHQTTLIEEANWKLVIENNRECYHCAGNHPELLATLVEFALPDQIGSPQMQALMDRKVAAWDQAGLPHRPTDGGQEFRCIRLPFHEGAVSFTADGSPACRKLLGDLTDPDLGSVRMFRAPNNWNHFLSDHIIHFRILPLGVDRTALQTTWLVHEDAIEGVDYDVTRLTEVWEATNRQDAMLGAINHQGIWSRAYRPGRYAPSEFMLVDFTGWYTERLARHFGAPARAGLAA